LAETPEKEPEAERLSRDPQFDKERAALKSRSSRMPSIIVSLLVLTAIGAAGTFALPEFDIALPKFSNFAQLFPREPTSLTPAPATGPDVSATLKDIQSAQERSVAALQENGAALQQNTAIFQQGATALESLRQGFTVQQTNLKTISNQLSSLIVRVDSLHNALMPLTTSSIPQAKRARFVRTARQKPSRLPDKPVGPVSVGGAPLNPMPGNAG
jgi:hypothetical protein